MQRKMISLRIVAGRREEYNNNNNMQYNRIGLFKIQNVWNVLFFANVCTEYYYEYVVKRTLARNDNFSFHDCKTL